MLVCVCARPSLHACARARRAPIRSRFIHRLSNAPYVLACQSCLWFSVRMSARVFAITDDDDECDKVDWNPRRDLRVNKRVTQNNALFLSVKLFGRKQ